MAKPRTLIGIAAQQVRDDVVRAAHDRIDLVGVYATPDALIDHLGEEFDLIIADVAALRAMGRRIRRGRLGISREAPGIILVLSDIELRDALGLLNLCRGILFWQHDLDKLRRLIVITLEGYSGVPSKLLPDLITDRVRIGLIDTLSPIERMTLRLLAQALSNRAIAHTLEVPEPVAKSLVRTVLTKLRLKNRTEAAVLAVRWFGPGSAAPERDLVLAPEEQVAS